MTKFNGVDKIEDDYIEGQARFKDGSKNEGKFQIKFSFS